MEGTMTDQDWFMLLLYGTIIVAVIYGLVTYIV